MTLGLVEAFSFTASPVAGSSLQPRHKPSLFDVLIKSVEREVGRFICHLFLLTHFVPPIEEN